MKEIITSEGVIRSDNWLNTTQSSTGLGILYVSLILFSQGNPTRQPLISYYIKMLT